MTHDAIATQSSLLRTYRFLGWGGRFLTGRNRVHLASKLMRPAYVPFLASNPDSYAAGS